MRRKTMYSKGFEIKRLYLPYFTLIFVCCFQSKNRSPATGLGWFKLKNLRRGSSCEETGGKSPRVGRAAVEAWGAQEVGTWLAALGLTEYK